MPFAVYAEGIFFSACRTRIQAQPPILFVPFRDAPRFFNGPRVTLITFAHPGL